MNNDDTRVLKLRRSSRVFAAMLAEDGDSWAHKALRMREELRGGRDTEIASSIALALTWAEGGLQ